MYHPFGLDYDAGIAPDRAYLPLLSRGNREDTHVLSSDPNSAISGFGDVVDPYLHATTPTNMTNEGWCSPTFSDQNRCFSDATCRTNDPNAVCMGNVPGLGLDPTTFPGLLGMETDHDLLPDAYQPHDGDRTVVYGRWIVDCGHGDQTGVPLPAGYKTEIHPPLVVATGRSTGAGSFAAKCSGEQTCSSVIGRPYLVSQGFGDGFLVRHLSHEVEKLGCFNITGPAVSIGANHFGPFAGLPDCADGLNLDCICNGDLGCIACETASCAAIDACVATCIASFGLDCGCIEALGPLGPTCTTQLEARPRFGQKPFSGMQEAQYYIQPANSRLHPGDRMLVKWQLTARHGVAVALSNGAGDAGMLVDVTMDDSQYSAPALPAKQDWEVFSDEIPVLDLIDLVFFFPGSIAQTFIVNDGVFTDRYQAPQAPANDTSPNIEFADQLDGTMQAADIDDSQPFPVSGRLNVGWFRCSAGGPYGADCAGPRTSVTLDGSGSSDPDGNPLTYTWTGPFLGGTATGVMPTVKFMGGGTFPITLTVSNGTVSTSCTSSVTIHPAAILQLGGASTNVTGDAGGVNGDVCIGPNGSLNVTGAQSVTGTIHLAPGDTLTKSGTGTIGPVLRNQDLSTRIADATAAATDLAALPCTQSFATWKTSQVVTGTGGQNVICVGDVTLSGTSTVVLSGGATDTFIVKVTGKFKLTDSSKILASGVPRSAIFYDVVGAGQVGLSSLKDSGGANCCTASVDGSLLAVGRSVSFGPGLVNGQIVSGQGISLGGGSSVR